MVVHGNAFPFWPYRGVLFPRRPKCLGVAPASFLAADLRRGGDSKEILKVLIGGFVGLSFVLRGRVFIPSLQRITDTYRSALDGLCVWFGLAALCDTKCTIFSVAAARTKHWFEKRPYAKSDVGVIIR